MVFLLSLFIEGVLAGALYALMALAFVVIYKASRVINFALGELVMLAALLVATGLHVLGLDLVEAMAAACLGMFVFALLSTRWFCDAWLGSRSYHSSWSPLALARSFEG